jgi:hypothetical protein
VGFPPSRVRQIVAPTPLPDANRIPRSGNFARGRIERIEATSAERADDHHVDLDPTLTTPASAASPPLRDLRHAQRRGEFIHPIVEPETTVSEPAVHPVPALIAEAPAGDRHSVDRR